MNLHYNYLYIQQIYYYYKSLIPLALLLNCLLDSYYLHNISLYANLERIEVGRLANG